jgi:PAS domain S-box-containing protein
MLQAASSIGRKLNLIVATTTVVALALAAAALLVVDFQRGLTQAREEARTLADVLALASAPALSFSDAKVAAENLSMLRAKPNVVRAALYDAQGRLFASFLQLPAPDRPAGAGVSVSGNFVDAWRPIVSNGEHVGTIWLQVRHERLSQALQSIGIVALIMAASLGGALLLSRRIQLAITAPIREVSDVARSIIQGDAAGVRAIRRSDDEVGNLVDAFNAMLDDLERRSRSLQEANEALRRSETRYQLAVRGSSAGLWDWDIADRAFFISPRFRDLLGYTAGEMPDAVGAVLALLHPDDAPRVRSALAAHLRERAPFQLECRLRDSSGHWRWFYMAGAALWDEKGLAYRMAGSVVEVTERKEAERVLQEANRAKDEFLATLAHELRNPLAPIRTGLEILRRDKANGLPSEQARGTMERQLAHMVRLIDDLLDISRINSGKIQIAPERVDLLKVVETALELSRPAMNAAGHRLVVDVPRDPVFLMGDATRLAQALGNLLNNAARYTPGGGRIALHVRPQGRVVEIAIEDNGEGIPAHMLENIFQLFTQVRAAGRGAQGGLGIGLFLVRSLIQLHGGTVAASSDGEGAGSTFTVRLPCFDARAADASRPREGSAGPSLAGLKVLVVDDNVDAAQTLSLVLEMEGCVTAMLHEGSSVSAQAAAFQPDVILLDIGLPDMTGHEVAERLRSNPAFAHVLLIAITGWGAEQDRKRSAAAGFDHHLTKPVEIAALEPLLRKAVAGRNVARTGS